MSGRCQGQKARAAAKAPAPDIDRLARWAGLALEADEARCLGVEVRAAVAEVAAALDALPSEMRVGSIVDEVQGLDALVGLPPEAPTGECSAKPLREDVVQPSLPRVQALANAPQHDDVYFLAKDEADGAGAIADTPQVAEK